MKKTLLFLVLWGVAAPSHLEAQIPRSLSYQGVLTDSAGTPKPDGTYSFTFRLYESASGGTPVGTQQQSLTVTRGLFHTVLDQLLSGVNADRPYWHGIQVGNEAELSPRVPLTAVLYSLSSIHSDTARYAMTVPQQAVVDSARIAGTVPNNTISTAKLEDEAVVSAKIADGTIQFADIGQNGAAAGQVMKWNGSSWTPGNDSVGAGGGSSQWTTSGSNIYYNTGNVGVGVSSPNTKLQVHSVSGAGNVQLTSAVTGTAATDGFVITNDGASTAYLLQQENADMIFGVNSIPNLILKPNGRVGIGTITPNAPLAFPPSLGKKVTLYPGTSGDVGFGVSANLLEIYADHSNADIAFGYDQGGTLTERMRVKGNGNVGIGTSTPSAKLHVMGAGYPNSFGLFDTENSGQDAGLRFNEAGLVKSHIYHEANTNTLNLYGSGFAGISVDSTGKVGIGTTNPTATLQVEGMILSSSGGIKFPDGTIQTTSASSGGIFLPLSGGTMSGAITNTGDPPITMGKGNFGSGNINMGTHAFVAGSNNRARGAYSVVSGGGGAELADSNLAIGDYSAIGGGRSNTASNSHATVGGGWMNTASADATVGGGRQNSAGAGATVAGGFNNGATGVFATVGGGNQNTASANSATVSGGFGNTASGLYSTVPGGRVNTAQGNYSLAAGFRAKANHNASFVWADDTFADFVSTANNQFLIRASGGVGIGTNSPQARLHVKGAGYPNSFGFLDTDINGQDAGLRFMEGGIAKSHLYHEANTNTLNLYGSGFAGVSVDSTGKVGIGTTSPTALLHVNGTSGNNTGVWSNLSDRRLKEDIEPIRNALQTVTQLEGVTFRWKDEKKDKEFGRVRGFIAQDVEKVIPEWIRTDPDNHKRIEPIGIDALLLEAIKEQQKQIEELKQRIAELENHAPRVTTE